MSGEAYKPIRLTLSAASREFGVTRDILRSRLRDVEPVDGGYTIRQILDATHDSSKALKDAEVKERTEHWRLKNRKLRGELLDRSKVEGALGLLVTASAQVIKGSNLSKKDQSDVLENLSNCVKALDQIAEEQAREMGEQLTITPSVELPEDNDE